MKRQTKYIGIILIFLLAGSLTLLFFRPSARPEIDTLQSGVEIKEITIDTFGFVSQTALEATRSFLNGNIQTQGEGANAYVIALNGKAADSVKKEYWELVVNGKPAEVGAGSYIIKSGDSIIWRLSTF